MENAPSRLISRGRARGRATISVFTAVALSQFTPFFQAHADNGSFPDFPFLVHCEVGGVDHVFYLSKISPEGVAVFLSPDRQAGTITVKGKAEAVGGDGSGNCAGKTLGQLRSAGQAYDLQR
jgi:hypothetical protein